MMKGMTIPQLLATAMEAPQQQMMGTVTTTNGIELEFELRILSASIDGKIERYNNPIGVYDTDLDLEDEAA